MLKTKYVLILALITGCATTPKTKTMKQETTDQWNNARSAVYYNLAKQQYESSDFAKSRESVDQSLTLEPKNVQSLLLSAKLWIENGQLEAAERQLDLARNADPKNAEADYLSGIVYQRWQMPSLALDHYTLASTKAPAELAYVLARAEMLFALDHADDALTLLASKAQYFEHSAALRDAMGQILVDRGRYTEAVEMFRQASLLADSDDGIRQRLGMAMYYAKDYKNAADVLTILAARPDYTDRFDVLLALGDCDLQLNRAHDALNYFQSAAEANPNSPAIWLKASEAALQMNDLHWAQIAINKAIALDNTSARVQVMLGYLRLRQNRLADSLTAFINANRLNPNDALSITMTGYVYEKRGLKKEAAECYARALQLHPGDDLAKDLMAKIPG